MCLIVFSYNTVPHLPLILLANRDENYRRPALPIGHWSDDPNVVGGRDTEAGGSWLALNRNGRFAAFTNVRTSRTPPKGKLSRGLLVSNFVTQETPTLDYAREVAATRHEYAPFNLLFGRVDDLFAFHSPRNELRRLIHGLHGISNGQIDAPWPKVRTLFDHLKDLPNAPDDETCFTWLANRTPSEMVDLPNTGAGAGVERLLSPVFIALSDYGTRASTVLTVSNHGEVRLSERSYHAGRATGTQHLTLRLTAL